MESQSNQDRLNSGKSCRIENATQSQVPAMSAHQIIASSGSTNMLEGRTIRLNLSAQKKS